MIEVEGYKAFRGKIKVTPRCDSVPAFELEGEFLYKPDTQCWYGNGSSFAERIVEILEDRGE